jgi:hypothetical protein
VLPRPARRWRFITSAKSKTDCSEIP